MTKAKLIKRDEIEGQKQVAKTELQQKNNVLKTVDAMKGWIEQRRVQREDPRKAFAALFTLPQPQ